MALSNIVREPRREITETLVGLVPVAGLIYTTNCLASLLYTAPTNPQCPPYPVVWIVSFALIILAVLPGVEVARLVHFIGERGCALLDSIGLYLRPIEARRLKR